MEEETGSKNLKHMRTAMLIITCIVILCVLKWSSEVSLVLVLAVFLYLLLSPLARRMEKSKFPPLLATIISMLVLLVIIAAAFIFFFYAVDLLMKTLPRYGSRLAELESYLTKLLSKVVDLPSDFTILGGLNVDWISLILSTLRSVSSMAITIISKGVLVLIFVMFLLAERDTVVPKVLEFVKHKDPGTVEQLFFRINRQVSKYLALKSFISILTGIAFFLCTKAVGLEFASLCGVLAFVMNFIPTIGSIIVTIMTIMMAVLQFFPAWSPILFVAFGTLIIEGVLGNIIDPKIQGNQLNLSPFVLLVSLTLWGYIWGIIGMFLAVPMMSILQIIFANIDQTKPFAVLLSSGSKQKQKKEKKKKNDDPDQNFKDSIVLPSDRKQ